MKQLKYFKTIVDAGSISSAAKMLYMAQPPLSQQLKHLEEELEAVLINRDAKKWSLTEAGNTLYQHAAFMLQKSSDIKKEIQEINQGIRGHLSIGVSATCISYLPSIIQTYRDSHPNVYIEIWKGDSSYLEALLQDGTIEVALMLLPGQLQEYRFVRLEEEPFVLAAPKLWEADFTKGAIHLEQLINYPFLMLAPMEGYSVFEDIIHYFQKHNLSPNVIMECKDIETLLALVASGVGISIIPRSEIQEAYHHDIITTEIEGFELYVEPAVVSMKNRHLTRAAECFRSQFTLKNT
ncbi:LysR family transcriptional regulator [Lentibacillus kapialis]|nr:LysR family transcriptional regulator [Lentibacillus kapialis]